jgi:hypothetical protein
MLMNFVVIISCFLFFSFHKIEIESTEYTDYKIKNFVNKFDLLTNKIEIENIKIHSEIDEIRDILNFHIDKIFYLFLSILTFIIVISVTVHNLIQDRHLSSIENLIYNERLVEIEKLLKETNLDTTKKYTKFLNNLIEDNKPLF